MALTEDGQVLAVDGKVTLDDNAAFRQEHARFADTSSTAPIEARAIVKPVNFLDLGGGASAEVRANGLEIVRSDPGVRRVLVNVVGGITACDAVANGIVSAIGMLTERGDHVDRPIVVLLDGNNASEGRRILDEAAISVVEQVPTMDGAAKRAAELASAAKGA